MALKELKYIYQALGLTSARHAVAQFDLAVAGTIKEIHIHAPNIVAGTHKFNFSIGGVGQYEPENYFTLTAADKQDSKTGLDIAVAQYDLLQFDYKTNGGNLTSPIYFSVIIDDGAAVDASDVTVDDANFSVITGTDAQTALDSVDDELAALDQDISDINAKTLPAGGTAGQILAKIDSTDYNTEWVNQSGGGGVEDLDDLSDVNLSSPSNGDVLTYDGSEWINAPASGGGGGASPSIYFSDDFDDGSLDAWFNAVDKASETDGVLRLASIGGALCRSASTHSWYDKEITVKLTTMPPGSSTHTRVHLSATGTLPGGGSYSDGVGFSHINGSLRIYNGGSLLKSFTFGAGHLYMRMRIRLGGVTWQASADGATWATIFHYPSTQDLSALYLCFYLIADAVYRTAEFDDLVIKDYANV